MSSVCMLKNDILQIASGGELVDVLKSLHATLNDCTSTLDQLQGKLSNAGHGKVAKQWKLTLRMGDILMFRQRLQSHIGSANVAMQAINL
jgi:hypothetical protein